MKLNHRTQNCVECEFMRMYDYGNKIYYCDHVDRTDDMGNNLSSRVRRKDYGTDV